MIIKSISLLNQHFGVNQIEKQVTLAKNLNTYSNVANKSLEQDVFEKQNPKTNETESDTQTQQVESTEQNDVQPDETSKEEIVTEESNTQSEEEKQENNQ